MTRLQRAQLRQPIRAHIRRVRAQIFRFNHIQHGEPNRARNGIAAERIEIFHPVRKCGGNFARRNHAAQRMPVARGLAERDNIGQSILCLKRPHVRPDAPEPDLHFIGNTNRARRARVRKRAFQIALREKNLSAAARNGFGHECRRVAVFMMQAFQNFADCVRVFFCRARVARAKRAAICVGKRRNVRRVGSALAALAIEFVRTHINQRLRVAVIRVVNTNHIAAIRVRARQTQRKLIRLTARIGEKANRQRRGQSRGQTPRVLDNVVVQITRVRVQHLHLLLSRAHHARTAMPHMTHIVDAIQIRVAVLVVQILPDPAHNF